MPERKHVIWTTGKRKTAVARIRMIPGSGTITINERQFEDYFRRDTSRMRILEPLELTETKAQYDILAKVHGGGLAAQADAIRHGISRALIEAVETLRPALRKGGMLT